MLTPSAKREAIRIMAKQHGLPTVRACQSARLPGAAYYTTGTDWAARVAEVIAALPAIVTEDFMRDTSYGGSVFRTLNVIDDGNRGDREIDVAASIPARGSSPSSSG
jgi:hypothetical protein